VIKKALEETHQVHSSKTGIAQAGFGIALRKLV